MKKNGFTLIELMIAVAIIGILVSMLSGAFMQWGFSDGTRSGMVVKLSSKGLLFKSWEGELMLGSANSGQPWDFSITRASINEEELADALSQAQISGHRVTVSYHQGPYLPWHQETSYSVLSVQEVR